MNENLSVTLQGGHCMHAWWGRACMSKLLCVAEWRLGLSGAVLGAGSRTPEFQPCLQACCAPDDTPEVNPPKKHRKKLAWICRSARMLARTSTPSPSRPGTWTEVEVYGQMTGSRQQASKQQPTAITSMTAHLPRPKAHGSPIALPSSPLACCCNASNEFAPLSSPLR